MLFPDVPIGHNRDLPASATPGLDLRPHFCPQVRSKPDCIAAVFQADGERVAHVLLK
jgi:hypothetical protein